MWRFVSAVAALTTVLVVIASTRARSAECTTASTTCIHATPSTFATAVSQARAGDTILLGSGDYGTWSGTNKAITVAAESGASPSMRVDFDSGNGGFTLDGMVGMGGSIRNGANHITIRNSSFSSALVIDGVANAAIMIDHNTFANIDAPSGSPNARIALPYSSATPSGVTVSHNLMSGGDSDGVHTGTALDVLDNEFVDLCDRGGNHTDNIQFEGAVGGRVAGNYIHLSRSCTTQGITSYDGGTNGVVVEDNVVDIRRPWGIEFYADKNSIIRHNTLPWHSGCDYGQTCGQIALDHKSGDPAGSGTQVYDNIASSVDLSNGSTAVRNDHNLSGQSVSYVGGSQPATWAGFALAATSPGKGSADDGADIGIRTGDTSPPPDSAPPPPDSNPPPSDTTPPDTTITAGPSGPTNDTTPTFALTASQAGSTFACRVDSGAYATCTSPWTTPALTDGSHTVTVRATDPAGNVDASPATRGFTVDTVAPRTTITSAPPAQTDSSSASIAFSANEAGSTAECRLDGGGWTPCTSPYQVSGLAGGQHTVGVRSTDPAGNVESPGASATWSVGSGGNGGGEPPPAADAPPTVQITAPTVDSALSGRFRFAASASDDHGVDHVDLWVGRWRVDSDQQAPYVTYVDASRMRSGLRTLTARAFDAAGQAASAAMTVRIGGGQDASGWAQLTSTAGDGITRLAGQTVHGGDVRVSLTPCNSSRGTVVDQFTLHADVDGDLDATYAGSNRCVLRLDPVTG